MYFFLRKKVFGSYQAIFVKDGVENGAVKGNFMLPRPEWNCVGNFISQKGKRARGAVGRLRW